MVRRRLTRGQRLLLQVCDSGMGIRDGDRERVFEEFVQVHEPAPVPTRRGSSARPC